jgi:hypothetical protein
MWNGWEYGPMSILGSVLRIFTVLFRINVLLLTLRNPRQCCNWRLYITEVSYSRSRATGFFGTSLAIYIFFVNHAQSQMCLEGTCWIILCIHTHVIKKLVIMSVSALWNFSSVITYLINWFITFMNYTEFVIIWLSLQTNKQNPTLSIVYCPWKSLTSRTQNKY